jgi:tetratricopeptide (TPR) repeat protein
MASINSKTKEEELLDLGNNLIMHLRESSGLLKPDPFYVKKMMNSAEKNKEGDYAVYWCILSLLESVNTNYDKAKAFYDKAFKIDKGRHDLRSNYIALLFKLSKFEDVFEQGINHLKVDSSCEYTFSRILRSSYFTLNTDSLNEAISLFEPKSAISKEVKSEGIEAIENILSLARDIESIGVSSSEYKVFTSFLNKFNSKKSHEEAKIRFSIENRFDQFVRVESFLTINSKQAVDLNAEFDSLFIEYALNNDCLNSIGSFVTYFKSCEDIDDGRENPHAVYNNTNRSLVI